MRLVWAGAHLEATRSVWRPFSVGRPNEIRLAGLSALSHCRNGEDGDGDEIGETTTTTTIITIFARSPAERSVRLSVCASVCLVGSRKLADIRPRRAKLGESAAAASSGLMKRNLAARAHYRCR